jgi:iron complex outermembrane receptor protein
MIKGMQTNPRLGVIWDATKQTTFKLLYGSAFRAPNVYERDIGTFGTVANPNNIEERIKTYEGVAEWRPLDGTKLTGSLFINDYTQVLHRDDVSGMFVNSGKFTGRGFDLGAEQRWPSGRDLKASFNHTVLYDQSGGMSIWATDAPKNVAKVQYAEPLYENMARAGVENIFVDKRKTLQNDTAHNYDVTNINLTSNKIYPGFEASVGVYNLFNAHPQMVGGSGFSDFAQDVILMNGRSALLTMQYTF